MKLSRVSCALILALSAVSCAPSHELDDSSLTSLRAADDTRGWRGDKAVTGDVQGSPEEDLVYGDDVLPPRTRLRNKRRRRKRIRPQRPLPLLDYDDVGEQYRPRLRPRLRPRPLFEKDGEEPFPVEERRPRPGGKRRKPPHHFQDVADGDVADKPGPPFAEEEEEFTNPRRRPSVYPRKTDHFPEDLPPRVKPHRFLQDDHEQYPAVSPQDDNFQPAHRPRKGPRRHSNINFPEPQEGELPHNPKEPVTRRKLPNKFDPSDETPEEPSTQMAVIEEVVSESSRQETQQEVTEELHQANDADKLSSSEKPPQAPQEGQRKPGHQTKVFLPRFDNNKAHVPRGESTTEPAEPPADMKPIAVSLDELLKIKNITLDQVLKENETTQKPSRTSQGPLRRLPSASEFFAKRKNMSVNKNENKPVNEPVNQTTEQPSRPRETKRKYGENKISIKEILPTTTTQPPETQRRPMPLSMQESAMIDPVNMSVEDELSSQDRELAKKILKNRITEANNSSKVQEFLQSNGIRLPPITEVILPNKSVQEVFDAGGDRPVQKKISLSGDGGFATSKPRDEILDLLRTESGSARLARILATRNMTLAELIEHRERGASHQHISNIFPAEKAEEVDSSTTPTVLAQENPAGGDSHQHISNIFPAEKAEEVDSSTTPSVLAQENPAGGASHQHISNIFPAEKPEELAPNPEEPTSKNPADTPKQTTPPDEVKTGKVPDLISIVNPLIYSHGHFDEPRQERGYGRDFDMQYPNDDPNHIKPFPSIHQSLDYDSPYKAIITSPQASTMRTFPIRIKESAEGLIIVDNVGQVQEVDNNVVGASYDTISVDHPQEEEEYESSYNILPIAVKSAIIASTAIFGLALVVFLTIFVVCKWRQKRARTRIANTRARSPILDDTLHQDVRHTKCSLSPVLVHADTYVEPRRYYLWRTIRNTLRYK